MESKLTLSNPNESYGILQDPMDSFGILQDPNISQKIKRNPIKSHEIKPKSRDAAGHGHSISSVLDLQLEGSIEARTVDPCDPNPQLRVARLRREESTWRS